MVADQIASRGITRPALLDAMRRLPRHAFMPAEIAEAAYEDHALPIGCTQTISQPYMVAIMTDVLAPEPGWKVLEVGTGSGYQAGILALMGAEVWTVERLATLAVRAQALLTRLGVTNVRHRVGDGTLGWPEEAPFDGIIVTAGAPRVPESLKQQLAGGGRLVIPTGSHGMQELLAVERRGDAFEERRHGACAFVPLVGEEGWNR
ncbi:MAG: protein-L-isoaspartate(D-aspartate) O-methyltransferase [Candidatus Eisenbacteria bacterium]|nr:protein-L-isoaspartate(D-aspartate) O-methyltransferase [Candidatus Eisenbacteria bacterium]